MLNFLRRFFIRDIGLKVMALVLALVAWFYIVSELNKGSEEERQFLNRVLPREGVTAKKLSIKPIFIGRPRAGYVLVSENVIVVPEYCIVVGTKNLLDKIRFAYTMPIDLSSSYKPFTKEVPLNPIAPGIYVEDTFVQVTVPIEKETK